MALMLYGCCIRKAARYIDTAPREMFKFSAKAKRSPSRTLFPGWEIAVSTIFEQR